MQRNKIPPPALLSNREISDFVYEILFSLPAQISAVHLTLNLSAFLANGETQYPHEEIPFDPKR